MKRSISLILKVFASIGLLWLLVYKCDIDFSVLVATIAEADKLALSFAVILAVLLLFAKSFRWRYMVLPHSPLGVLEAFRFYLEAFALGVVTPGRLGEFFKVYQLCAGKKMTVGRSLETVLSDRFFDLFFLVWIGSAGALYWSGFKGFAGNILTSVGVTLVLGLICLFAGVALLERLPMPKRFPKLAAMAGNVVDAAAVMLSKRGLHAWGVSLCAYTVYFYSNMLILNACGVEVDYFTTAFLFSVVGLVLLLPISIAGLGTREATMVFLLAPYGFDSSQVMAAALCQFAIYFLLLGAIGMLLLSSNPLKISEITAKLRALKSGMSDKA